MARYHERKTGPGATPSAQTSAAVSRSTDRPVRSATVSERIRSGDSSDSWLAGMARKYVTVPPTSSTTVKSTAVRTRRNRPSAVAKRNVPATERTNSREPPTTLVT
jgi:hypothetical protein